VDGPVKAISFKGKLYRLEGIMIFYKVTDINLVTMSTCHPHSHYNCTNVDLYGENAFMVLSNIVDYFSNDSIDTKQHVFCQTCFISKEKPV